MERLWVACISEEDLAFTLLWVSVFNCSFFCHMSAPSPIEKVKWIHVLEMKFAEGLRICTSQFA